MWAPNRIQWRVVAFAAAFATWIAFNSRDVLLPFVMVLVDGGLIVWWLESRKPRPRPCFVKDIIALHITEVTGGSLRSQQQHRHFDEMAHAVRGRAVQHVGEEAVAVRGHREQIDAGFFGRLDELGRGITHR